MRAAIGFSPAWPVLYRIYNILFAIGLVVFLSPLLVGLSIALFLTQGAGIFYLGPRVGINQRQFQIIKFRTLCPKRARAITQDQTLPDNSDIETPLGKLLRETRLDEIPQLFNIVNGDMNICGPRPVRAEIAAIERQRIARYDMRFEVRPGLIGPAQACFGHGASKRFRARVNNQAVRRPVSIPAELALLGRIGLSIVQRLAGKAAKMFSALVHGEATSSKDIWLVDGTLGHRSFVDRIDLGSIATSGMDLTAEGQLLTIRLHSGALRQAGVRLRPSGLTGVFTYEPVNEVSAYVIERYALGRVVVPPRIARPQRLSGAMEAQVAGRPALLAREAGA